MKKLSQIQVEPLSEQRWSRIERSLMSRLALEGNPAAKGLPAARSRWSGRAWLLAAAVLTALCGAVLMARGLPERARAEHPSRITTGSTSSHLALSGLSLDVEPQSAVVVGAETPQGILVVIDRGSIVCQVAPRANDAPLIVQAGEARVRVVGTRFRVTRLGESARVRVQEGVVEVSSRGGTVRVRAGEEWPAELARAEPAEALAVPSAPLLAFDDATKRPSSSPARSTAVAARNRTTSAAPTAESGSAQEPSPSRQSVFEEAALLERSDPARAAKLYAGLESQGDSWAQNALYARGRLEATRGNQAEARRLLERYLDRFPNGSNAEDARAVLSRLR
jgi:hypothetical protein